MATIVTSIARLYFALLWSPLTIQNKLVFVMAKKNAYRRHGQTVIAWRENGENNQQIHKTSQPLRLAFENENFDHLILVAMVSAVY